MHLPSLRLLSLASSLASAALASAWAADSTPTPTPGTTPPVAAHQETDSDAHQLVAQLPPVKEVVIEDGQVHWKADGAALTIAGVDSDTSDPLIATDLGQIHLPRHYLADHHTEIIPALPTLVAKAKAAGLSASDLTIQVGLLTGPSLRGKAEVVVAEGVMRKQALDPADRTTEVSSLTAAAEALLAALPSTGLDTIGQHALQEVIGKLDQADGGQALDEIAPSFARRVVHHGYLRQWYHGADGLKLVAAAEKAVDQVDALRATTSYEGDGLTSKEIRDAFATKSWVYTSPTAVRFAYEEPKAEYMGDGAFPRLVVAVDLPAGSDPITEAAKCTAARIFDHESNQLASWSKDQGFVCDLARWREVVAPTSRALVKEAIPPHILIRSLDGDVFALAVDKGLVHPVADHSHQAADKFLDEAAAMLTDNAHLDLVGEYFFAYVYPSPDAKHPELMGNKQMKSNVQQTVWQTCGNEAGGIMHGDCADIAELYQVLTQRQNHNPIIIGLPEHAACCWADKENDQWHVSVLQTGPPLEFYDAVLPQALEKAYKLFDPSMPFDANELPLLLRFSGETSRSEWVLSWRIFSEPKYCQTMIEVERDWQYETYQRGISTMQHMIATGDDDNANYRELCGLYTFTGQFDLAAEYCRKATERTDSPMSRLSLSIQMVGHLINAGKLDAAVAVANDVLDKQLPPLKDKLGISALQIELELAGACLNEEGGASLRPLALKTMSDELIDPMGNFIDRLSGWLDSSQFQEDQWDNSPEFRAIRSLTAAYAAQGTELLRQLGNDDAKDPKVQALTTSIQHYINGVCFHDLEDVSSVLGKYDLVGRWYGLQKGLPALDKLLDAATPATNAKQDVTHRGDGPEQLTKDLSWMRASVPYWYGRMADLFRPTSKTLDAAAVAHVTEKLQQAEEATIALGLANPAYQQQSILGQEVRALVAHDDQGLRKVLHQVAENNDKGLRDDAAQWLGDSARFMDLGWYKRVLAAWRDEVDYKPKYYWIAWRAALSKAPAQALMVAAMAAERFKDDPAFVEENDFMKTLLGPWAAKEIASGATSMEWNGGTKP